MGREVRCWKVRSKKKIKEAVDEGFRRDQEKRRKTNREAHRGRSFGDIQGVLRGSSLRGAPMRKAPESKQMRNAKPQTLEPLFIRTTLISSVVSRQFMSSLAMTSACSRIAQRTFVSSIKSSIKTERETVQFRKEKNPREKEAGSYGDCE